MKRTVDYTKRLTPKFDAVQDIKEYLGKKKWDEVSPLMAKVKSPLQFGFLAGLAGIEGFPVKCWYDLYHGEGAHERMLDALEQDDEEQEHEKATLWPVGQSRGD